jgi:hypothetical protein
MIWLILGGFSLAILLASQTSIESNEEGNVFLSLPESYRKMVTNAVSTGDPVIMINTANAIEVAGYKDAADALRRMAATAKK